MIDRIQGRHDRRGMVECGVDPVARERTTSVTPGLIRRLQSLSWDPDHRDGCDAVILSSPRAVHGYKRIVACETPASVQFLCLILLLELFV